MARIITKELAVKIADKLEAEILEAGAHDLAVVHYNGQIVATFGIRRASEKDKGHDHIPGNIFVGPGFAKLLAQCPKSREDWLEKLRETGKISDSE